MLNVLIWYQYNIFFLTFLFQTSFQRFAKVELFFDSLSENYVTFNFVQFWFKFYKCSKVHLSIIIHYNIFFTIFSSDSESVEQVDNAGDEENGPVEPRKSVTSR